MSTTLQNLKTQPASETDAAELTWYRNQNTFMENKEGKLTGLNLCGQELTDDQWQAILQEKFKKKEDWAHLQSLNLSENHLTHLTIPAEAASLRHLTVSENPELKRLVLEGALPALETLDARKCVIEEFVLPAGFEKLRILDMRENQLKRIDFQGDCPAMESLHIGKNKLTTFKLPAGFGKLMYLYLLDNEIESLAFPYPLTRLRTLHLRNNQLKQIPDNFLSLTGLETLYFHNNPLPEIQQNIIHEDERGNSLETVRDFLRASGVSGTKPNSRVKIIIVGNGRVGKTSLYKKLKGLPFNDEEPYTHGVSLGTFDEKDLPKVSPKKLDANVWDFGGQVIFYATHQFFLSDDALYILAWTAEDNVLEHRARDKKILPSNEKPDPKEEVKDFEKWESPFYWLENIRLRGKNSPVLMVQTHCDEKSLKIEEEYTKEPYNAVCLDFSSKEGIGLDILQLRISQKLGEVEIFGQDVPVVYDNAIELIEKEAKRPEKSEISFDEFREICREAKIPEGGEKSLLSYMKRTGVVVYFGDDEAVEVTRQKQNAPSQKIKLGDTIFIDPDWLTTQVYELINNELGSKGRNGKIDRQYLKEVFKLESLEIPPKINRFLELLQRFELIFGVQEKEESYYLAPQYLPPELDGNAKKSFDKQMRKSKLAFVFRFPRFMPDNVMINFLSRYGSFAEDVYWRNGIYFTKHDCDCIVKLVEHKKEIDSRFHKNDLQVFFDKNQDAELLQKEVFDAFVELSKHANAHISLDEKNFVDVAELKERKANKFQEVPSVVDSSSEVSKPVPISQFEHLLSGEFSLRFHRASGKESKAPIKMKNRTISIFLASSFELKADRDAMRLFIAEENSRLNKKGIFLDVIHWENFLDAMSKTRLQDEYNQAVEQSDIVLSLFFRKAGKFTVEELKTAWEQFKKTGNPMIFTYFKDAPFNRREVNSEDLKSLEKLEEELKAMGHYPTFYKNIDELKVQFKRQLEKLLDMWDTSNTISPEPGKTIIQQAEKIYNINQIDSADFS